VQQALKISQIKKLPGFYTGQQVYISPWLRYISLSLASCPVRLAPHGSTAMVISSNLIITTVMILSPLPVPYSLIIVDPYKNMGDYEKQFILRYMHMFAYIDISRLPTI
jgi:hypothetical protein